MGERRGGRGDLSGRKDTLILNRRELFCWPKDFFKIIFGRSRLKRNKKEINL